ncbi:heat shock factor-binding protein-like [Amaranthus tricolor]|uniref:heat shock factor-binding protein-like n=1 Tax=Amaranthus tricolor TaxID=29722 RepID=UPI00258903BF|nr:heat shock factor-binding protein-like [Amaranthus tricolor]
MEGHDSEVSDDPKQKTTDMTVFVQNLLEQMQTRFQAMSESIITKIDQMGNRIDELEQSIKELKAEIGAEDSPSPDPSSNSKSEGKPDETSE